MSRCGTDGGVMKTDWRAERPRPDDGNAAASAKCAKFGFEFVRRVTARDVFLLTGINIECAAI